MRARSPRNVAARLRRKVQYRASAAGSQAGGKYAAIRYSSRVARGNHLAERDDYTHSTKIRTGADAAAAFPSLNACSVVGPRPSVVAGISNSPDSPFTLAKVATVLSNCDRSSARLTDADLEFGRQGDASRRCDFYFDGGVVVVDEDWNDDSTLCFDRVGADADDAQLVVAVGKFRGIERKRIAWPLLGRYSRPST